MDDKHPDIDEGIEPIQPREHVARLVGDFRVMAEAEVNYYRARFSYSAGIAKSTSLFVALALFCVMGAVTALILGLLLALAEVIGFIGATFCMTLLFIVVAALFAMAARNNVRKLSFPEIEGEQPKL
jgi:Putative Actinobacterial Holin-X, holin superfamily III